jgi:hypothetical protein
MRCCIGKGGCWLPRCGAIVVPPLELTVQPLLCAVIEHYKRDSATLILSNALEGVKQEFGNAFGSNIPELGWLLTTFAGMRFVTLRIASRAAMELLQRCESCEC